MALTEKGRIAVNYIKEYYPTGKFPTINYTNYVDAIVDY